MKKLFAFSMLMALTLVSAPAFAEDQGTKNVDVTLTATMPHWINITAAATGLDTGITVSANGTNTDVTATTNTGIEAAYTISSNVPAGDNPKVTFTAKAGGAAIDANNALLLSDTQGNGKLAFGNTRGSYEPEGAAVANAISDSPALYTNKNVIVLPYTITNEYSTPDGASASTGAMATNAVAAGTTCDFNLREGVNTLKFTIAASTALEQLSLIDEPGDYKVKINLTASHT